MKPISVAGVLACITISSAHATPNALANILESSWALDDDAAAAQLAAALHFDKLLVGRAPLKNKAAVVVVDAKLDDCYLVAVTPSTGGPIPSGELEWSGPTVLDFSLKASSWAPDPFADPSSVAEKPMSLSGDAAKWNVPGFCAVKAGKVNLHISAELPGTKTTIRYVVLSVTRAMFPKRVLPWLKIRTGDWCDIDRREAMFLRPIPGTLVYDRGAPQVLVSVDDNSFAHMMEMSSVGLEETYRQELSRLTATPTGALKVPKLAEWPGCPNNNTLGQARSAMAQSVLTCKARIDQKYSKTLAQAKSQANALANAGATRIGISYGPSYERDIETQCGPLSTKAEKAFAKTIDRLVDAISEKPVVDELSKLWLEALQRKP